MRTYWIPKMKWQILDLLCLAYPNDRAKLKRKRYGELVMILKNIRMRG